MRTNTLVTKRGRRRKIKETEVICYLVEGRGGGGGGKHVRGGQKVGSAKKEGGISHLARKAERKPGRRAKVKREYMREKKKRGKEG